MFASKSINMAIDLLEGLIESDRQGTLVDLVVQDANTGEYLERS